MTRVESPLEQGSRSPLVPPYAVMLAGVGVVAVAALPPLAEQTRWTGLPAFLVLLGLLIASVGLTAGLAIWRSGLPAVGLWALATIGCVFGYQALTPSWDSLALLLNALAVVAAFAAILTAVPTAWRRFALSMVLIGHFVAIATAVAVVPPREGQSPWTASQIWVRFARPYLMFLNLNNGYHFYAPDPGPTALLWFRVEFADGSSRWVRMPDHESCANHLERRRWGALATAVSQTAPTQADQFADRFRITPAVWDVLQKAKVPEATLKKLTPLRDRELGVEQFLVELNKLLDRNEEQRLEPLLLSQARIEGLISRRQKRSDIPLGLMAPVMQYREPTLQSKMLLSSFARHVARTTTHPLEENYPVTGVKVYRVEYHNPPVEHFRAGREPLDPTLYLAFYQGEYDGNGQLKPSSMKLIYNQRGELIYREQDPLLYWLIPIVRIIDERPGIPPAPGEAPKTGVDVWSEEGRIVNYVRIHAGDKGEESVP